MSRFKGGPKVLVIDIETKPILAHVWDIWDQNVSLGQIKKDWSILSFSAKWLGDPPSKTIYKDLRGRKNVDDDTPILKKVWKLMDEADILLTQNGKKFDVKKLKARFILNKMKPPSKFKQIDTCEIARQEFGFTSNKLEYLTDKLCTKYKKLKHKKYPGFEMWKECISGNLDAWKCMEKYNRWDVLSLEELYYVLAPWSNKINFNLYREGNTEMCNCGSKDIQFRGYHYTEVGKFRKFCCKECGGWNRSSVNLLSKEKRASLKRRC
jgi:hypothetical protein